ncbi:Transcriptional regulatory protein ZraR [Gimesia maris]|uniref:sigma-54-dependent transcriptional regulator n=1 Tax=Gimesia maris TaxID=122 RepID=UPI001188CE67|nr:response regulator [Gimesia maris]QDU15086.1 Transcriptional regulatory protein ZraR [Gimesia maris]
MTNKKYNSISSCRSQYLQAIILHLIPVVHFYLQEDELLINSKTILVIDDDINIGKFVQNTLQKTGNRVLLALSSRDGLNYLKSDSIDVVFTDLHLPEVDGVNLIRKALHIHPNLVSVIMTGFGTFESSIEAIRLGVADYLTKPFNRQQLIASLQRALHIKCGNKKLSQNGLLDQKSGRSPEGSFIAESRSMQKIRLQIEQFSRMEFPNLIQGEIGVGKKTIAEFIHKKSNYADYSFIHINRPMTINTSTGTELKNVTLDTFDLISPPEIKNLPKTIFLEDIELLSFAEQKCLIHMIENGKIKTPWYSNADNSPLRLIASTTVDLIEEVSNGNFLRSLFDYLNLSPIKVPPLRDRRDDIKALGIRLLEKFGPVWKCNPIECQHRVDNETWKLLINNDWPGNLQELATILTRIVLFGENPVVMKELMQSQHTEPIQNNDTISIPLTGDLKMMEHQIIKTMIKHHGGNKAAAARALGIHRKSLYRILEEGKATNIPNPSVK